YAALMLDADFDAMTLSANIRLLPSRRMDAVPVIGDSPHWRSPAVAAAVDVPVAYAFLRTAADSDLVFLPDYLRCGQLAGEHLASIGRRRAAYISADEAEFTVGFRRRGFESAFRAGGGELIDSLTTGGD